MWTLLVDDVAAVDATVAVATGCYGSCCCGCNISSFLILQVHKRRREGSNQ